MLALPVAVLFPALWAAAQCRMVAAAASAGYFLAASRGLPQGAAAFFGSSVSVGFLFWIAGSVPFVIIHGLAWTARKGWRRAGHYGVAMVLTAVPPFGITGWAHPITAAGMLLPHWGWWGLLATALGLCLMATRLALAIALSAGVLTGIAAESGDGSPASGEWRGIDTAAGATFGRADTLHQQQSLIAQVRNEAEGGSKVIVLPESAFGILTPTAEHLLGEALANLNITVIAGAAVIDTQGYDTVMVALDRAGAKVLYRQRMPVPVAMWQPWRPWLGLTGGARATLFGAPVVEVAGQRIAPLICYEQLLVWPVLQSAFHRPDRIVAIANGWWAKDTSIPAIQRASVEAWARLFDLPLVTAFNR
ncbi:Apolipoprotein N-acyltransferase [Pleomorphomonas sp. T1.2MG-36]|nr:Apolipoprotein N-acyltransferase [Pleomorphomonas sp. T1.2MG-36]